MESLRIKEELFKACDNAVNSKIEELEQNIKRAQDALHDQTKSSAGDKFETGRAMMHGEINKFEEQLSKSMLLKKVLQALFPPKKMKCIDMGAIIETNRGNFYISVPVGKFDIYGQKFFTMGGNAPLAREFYGKRKGDECAFNGTSYKIINVA